MRLGYLVWIAIGAWAVAWSVLSALRAGSPGPGSVLRWLTTSRITRFLTLCAWAGAGWHLFCQRP
ncbi:MAG: DUF6186 family protein [Acidimicrobiales bacterium]